ncbi:MAG: hypothetical protein WBZ48_12085 [Bacteroidota bacterium]
MTKDHMPNGKSLLKEKEIFCTECNTSLENFCFSNGANDPEAIKKTLAQCKKSGKFVGDFCAKLFISDTDTLDSLWEKEPPK